MWYLCFSIFFFFQAEDGIRDWSVTGVQTCALPISDLSGEAIRLGRLLLELLREPEVTGLLALMLLQESRRVARATASGDLVLLEDQDRSLWNRELMKEGIALVEQALSSRGFGRYTIQA